MVQKLTKQEIKLLESRNWEILSLKPFAAVRYAQFAGGEHRLESFNEAREEIKQIKNFESASKIMAKKITKKKRPRLPYVEGWSLDKNYYYCGLWNGMDVADLLKAIEGFSIDPKDIILSLELDYGGCYYEGDTPGIEALLKVPKKLIEESPKYKEEFKRYYSELAEYQKNGSQ